MDTESGDNRASGRVEQGGDDGEGERDAAEADALGALEAGAAAGRWEWEEAT